MPRVRSGLRPANIKTQLLPGGSAAHSAPRRNPAATRIIRVRSTGHSTNPIRLQARAASKRKSAAAHCELRCAGLCILPPRVEATHPRPSTGATQGTLHSSTASALHGPQRRLFLNRTVRIATIDREFVLAEKGCSTVKTHVRYLGRRNPPVCSWAEIPCMDTVLHVKNQRMKERIPSFRSLAATETPSQSLDQSDSWLSGLLP